MEYGTGNDHTLQTQEGAGSIRFGSGVFDNSSVRCGSVRNIPGSTRFGLRFSDASWRSPVRFGSVPCPVPAGSRIKRFGSVRFGPFGSVVLFPPACSQFTETFISGSGI